MKVKKQFRLYDIYRYLSTEHFDNIKGISSFYCIKKDNTFTIHIYYVNKSLTALEGFASYTTMTEVGLRNIVKEVNKMLGNCRKPGKKRRRLQR